MKSPITDLVKALKEDDYYIGWKANIAMAFYDEFLRADVRRPSKKKLAKIANTAADQFLKQLMS